MDLLFVSKTMEGKVEPSGIFFSLRIRKGRRKAKSLFCVF